VILQASRRRDGEQRDSPNPVAAQSSLQGRADAARGRGGAGGRGGAKTCSACVACSSFLGAVGSPGGCARKVFKCVRGGRRIAALQQQEIASP